ncbi:hypothetical protein PM082_022564 [Marasmius tenuissimus]|nr:hypothetical protein PM082_022564 [Marasmius tenuissimus]
MNSSRFYEPPPRFSSYSRSPSSTRSAGTTADCSPSRFPSPGHVHGQLSGTQPGGTNLSNQSSQNVATYPTNIERIHVQHNPINQVSLGISSQFRQTVAQPNVVNSSNRRRHLKENPKLFFCSICGASLTAKHNLECESTSLLAASKSVTHINGLVFQFIIVRTWASKTSLVNIAISYSPHPGTARDTRRSVPLREAEQGSAENPVNWGAWSRGQGYVFRAHYGLNSCTPEIERTIIW